MQSKQATTPRSTRAIKSAALAVVIGVVAVFGNFFWPYVGLAAAILIPVIGIVVMIRAIVNELRGKRDDYVPGATRISHIPNKPAQFSHFSTPNPFDKDDEENDAT